MVFRKSVAVVTVTALFVVGLAPAAFAADTRSLTSARMHQAVQDTRVQASDARRAMDQLLQTGPIQAQIRRVGMSPDAIRAKVAALDDAEIVRLQAQVMPKGLQQNTSGLSSGAIVAIVVAGVAGIVIFYWILLREVDDVYNYSY
jgi:hypothetical protein